jgi:hypothetical protein
MKIASCIPSSARLLLPLALVLPVLAGAYGDGCVITIEPLPQECELDCVLATDDDGEELCECAEPVPCDVVADDGTVTAAAPGDVVSDDDCTLCRCRTDGAIVCEQLPPDECGGVCLFEGETYAVGESFPSPDGCNTCFCGEDGFVACTEMACPCAGADDPSCGGPGVCELDNGEVIHVGETIEIDDCNVCQCTDDGLLCTAAWCPTVCELDDGTVVEVGDSVPAPDGCNTCYCGEDGGLYCTEMACVCDPATDEDCEPPPPPTCEYEGERYEAGETFPAGDGCNTCSCTDDGFVACTLMACVCDDTTPDGDCVP